ncbi:MAG: hypothetical protein K2H41_00840 [Acetatifactor sp.]|nr:hypothetical protein [Acetatifactor sp.]
MLDFSKEDDVFKVDEKLVLNRIGVGVSKTECLARVGLNRQLARRTAKF